MPNPSELQRDREDPPPPGSDAAIAAGCTCPVIENGHGRGVEIRGERLYWYAEGCRLHWEKRERGMRDA